MATLILARHGETDWNRDGIWQGHGDPPLNELGRSQAAELAARLAEVQIDVLYSSDLRRAYETADDRRPNAKGLEITADPDLREMDVGVVEWPHAERLRTRFPGMASTTGKRARRSMNERSAS